MKYQAIFMDLDGTLVSDSMIISERTMKSIKRIKNKLKVSIVSGRQQEIVLEYAKQLKLDFYQVCDGGSRIIDINGKTIWATYINESISRKVIGIVRQFSIEDYECSDDGNTVFSINDIKAWKISKMAILAVNYDCCYEISQELKNIPHIKFFKTKKPEQSVWNIDITNEIGTKYHGVTNLIKISGVTKDSSIGIGDGFNDIPLLEATGLKIAMGNAPDELKRISAFVTSSVYDEGLAVAIDKYIV